jgi:hypothetical protein
MIAIDVEPDSMFPQRVPHIVLVTCSRSARPFLAWHKLANWDAAVYCAWVVRDSLVVGEIKRWLRNDAGSIDLGADTAFLVRPQDVPLFNYVRAKSVAAFLLRG